MVPPTIQSAAATPDKTEAVPVGEVDAGFMERVERYQGKLFQRIGMFDPELLREVVERIIEKDFAGEVEVLFTSEIS